MQTAESLQFPSAGTVRHHGDKVDVALPRPVLVKCRGTDQIEPGDPALQQEIRKPEIRASPLAGVWINVGHWRLDQLWAPRNNGGWRPALRSSRRRRGQPAACDTYPVWPLISNLLSMLALSPPRLPDRRRHALCRCRIVSLELWAVR